MRRTPTPVHVHDRDPTIMAELMLEVLPPVRVGEAATAGTVTQHGVGTLDDGGPASGMLEVLSADVGGFLDESMLLEPVGL